MKSRKATLIAACRVLPTLEFLPLIPIQENVDSLQAFLAAVTDDSLAVEASKARLVAKLAHQVQWVQQHLQSDSELCRLASELASSAAATQP